MANPFLKAFAQGGGKSYDPNFKLAPAPVPSYSGTGFNFAAYINNHASGKKTDAANVGLASQGEHSEMSVFGKTMSWLGSLGTGVENILEDMATPSKPNYGGRIANDVGSALTHFAQPVIDLGPVHTPWEKKVSDYIYKHNITHHGEHFTSGSELLKTAGIDNKYADAIGGFGLDVLTDPLTFTGVAPFVKGLKLAGKAAGIAKGAEKLVPELSRGIKADKAVVSLQRGQQAAQEAGFAEMRKAILPKGLEETPTVARVSDSAVEKQLMGEIVRPGEELTNKGMQNILVAKGIARTKGGKFIPAAVDKTLGDIARAGGTLAPSPATITGATGQKAVQAVRTAAKFAATHKSKVLKPKDQAKLFDRIYSDTSFDKDIIAKAGNKSDTPVAKMLRRTETIQRMKNAEATLKEAGHEFHAWNGQGLTMTDVIQEIPADRFVEDLPKVLSAFRKKTLDQVTNPQVQEYVANALARRNLSVGTVAKDMYDKIALEANAVQGSISPAKYRDWLNGTADEAFQAARPMGMTEKEANALKDLVVKHTTLSDVEILDAYQVVDAAGTRLVRAFLDGRRDPKFIADLNNAIAKGLGIPVGRVGKILAPVKNVEEAMANRFTTWYGRGSMLNTARSEFSYAQNAAKARNSWIGQIRKDYTSEQVNAAWRSIMRPLDQLMEGQLDAPTLELSNKFRDYFDNIIGENTRFGQMVAHSTAVDSQMIAADLNRHIKAVFGTRSNFAIRPDKDGKWLDSVYNFNVIGKKSEGLDPTTFLYNFDLAIQRTLAEYNLVDDFAMRFGAKRGTRAFDPTYHTHEIAHGRAAGYKFDNTTAREFNHLLEDLRKGSWRPGSKETQFMTGALRKWKSGVTIYYPSHHIRNLVGDTWLMWASGINDPRVFHKALRIIGSQRKRYEAAIRNPDLSALQGLIDKGASDWIQTEGTHVVTNKWGTNIRADEYYHAAQERGILVDAQRLEDIQGDALTGGRSLTRPFGGQLHASISTISEYREHYVRLAHLVGYVEKNMSRSVAKRLAATDSPLVRQEIMSDLMDKAAQDIRKWHPDGTDLTYWEQKYMRNIAPFYSWMRKAVPLLFESMMLHPAKVQAYPRAMFAMQQMMGIDAPGIYQPFPEDQLYPDWLMGAGIGPTGDPQSDNPVSRFLGRLGTNAIVSGQEKGYTVLNPGGNALPETMIGQFFGMGSGGEFKEGLEQTLNPFARIGAEVMTGTQTNGAPIGKTDNGNGYLSYAMGQMPQTSFLQRFTQVGKSGQQDREGGPNWEALVNILTAAGVTGTGKYTKSAEFDAKARAKRNGGK